MNKYAGRDFDVDAMLRQATSATLPEETEARLQTQLDDFRKRLAQSRERGRLAEWFRTIPRWAAVLTAVPVTILMVIGILCLRSPDVLAQTAERMKVVRTVHYEMTFPGNSDKPFSDCWSRGDKTYCHVRVKDGVFAEEWMDSKRWVVYSKDENSVLISPPDAGLDQAFSIIQLVHDLKPVDWKTLSQQTISESGRKWLVVEMPGTGKFSGMGTSGDTRVRLWIDEKTALPGKLEGLLRTKPGAEWTPFINFRFIWDTPEPPESLFEPKYPPDAHIRERHAETEPSIVPAEPRIALSAGEVLAHAAESMKGVQTLHIELTAPTLDAQVAVDIWSRADKIYCSTRRKDRVVVEEWANSDGFVSYFKEENRVIISATEPGLQVRSIVEWVNGFKPSDWKLVGQGTISERDMKCLVFEMPGTGSISGLRTSGHTRSRLWVEVKTALPAKLEVQQHSSSGTGWATFAIFRFLSDNSNPPDTLFEPKYPQDAKVTKEQH